MEPPAENVEFLRRGLFCSLRLFGASVRRGFTSPAWGLSSLLPFGHVIPPSGGVWDACAARFRFPSLELKQLAALRARDSAVRRSWDVCAARFRLHCTILFFAALRARDSALRRSWDACAARLCFPSLGLKQLAALLARDSALRRSLDACAARGKAGPVMGLRPLLGPPCIPPEAPPRELSTSIAPEGDASLLRELPSLASLAQVISLRAALMPESAFASINIRFSQLPSGLWLITGYASFPFQHPVDM